MTITQQIEGILDKRLGRGAYAGNGRLQKIEGRIKTLKSVLEKVEQMDALIATVRKQIEQKQGAYFNMLSSDPEALSQFDELTHLYESGGDTLRALSKLNEAIGQLEQLKQRFSREAIRIAFIGRERQGKSTFIKTITGLNNKVVPAYSGNSCTGAVSVIHNVDRVQDANGRDADVKVTVDYYDTISFLEMVNLKLKMFFPDGQYHVGRLEQLQDFVLPDSLSNEATLTLEAQYTKFKESVIDHYADYSYLIGVGTRTYYDENEIAQHVAQYEEFNNKVENSYPVEKNDGSIVYRTDYYKYIAVKSVDIYTRFSVDTTKKLELVDTIGIGSAADSETVKAEMYRVLRDDCDAAINVFRPDITPSWPKEQVELLDEISVKLKDRNPDKWIIYVLNKITSGIYMNAQSASSLLQDIKSNLQKKDVKPVAWVKAIDGSDFEDVSDSMVTPLLSLIANGLDSLDEAMTATVNETGKEAYNECLCLIKAANAVTSASAGYNADALSLFDENLFNDLLKSFGYAMNQIDQKGYATKRDAPCFQLEQAYDNIIGDIDIFIPEERKILECFETGALATQNQVFEEYVEQMRNDIFTAFENVNADVLHPLQEKVKTDLIEILFNQGLLKNLPSSYDTPSIEWLRDIIDNYVDEIQYPALRKALQFILDYQINIEGLVEYNVTKSLYIIDKTHSEFIGYKGEFTEDFEQKASDVWQELCNRIIPVQERLRKWISSYTLIPSHSFYSRVHKFHIKVMTDTEGREDFRRFYRKNMGLIWAGEINAAGKTQRAFGDWTERVTELQKVVTGDNFKLN